MFTGLKVINIMKRIQEEFELPKVKIKKQHDLYKDLNFDENGAVFATLLFYVEEKFGFELTDNEIQEAIEKVRTVKDLIRMVELHKKRK